MSENRKTRYFASRAGFSLVEVLVTLALTGIIMSAVYAVYIASLQTGVSEENRVDLQQSQRFAMDLLMSQLRHAGYDKTDSSSANVPTIHAAGQDYIYFSADYSGCDQNVSPSTCTKSATGLFPDGDINDPGEHIVFCVFTDANGVKQLGFTNSDGIDGSPDSGNGTPDFVVGDIDTNNDGLADPGHSHGSVNHQAIAPVEELEFYYNLSSGAPTVFPADPELIRSVQISLLTRGEKEDKRYVSNSDSFTPASGAGPWTGYSDGFRRRLMIVEVNFRNMGL